MCIVTWCDISEHQQNGSFPGSTGLGMPCDESAALGIKCLDRKPNEVIANQEQTSRRGRSKIPPSSRVYHVYSTYIFAILDLRLTKKREISGCYYPNVCLFRWVIPFLMMYVFFVVRVCVQYLGIYVCITTLEVSQLSEQRSTCLTCLRHAYDSSRRKKTDLKTFVLKTNESRLLISWYFMIFHDLSWSFMIFQ